MKDAAGTSYCPRRDIGGLCHWILRRQTAAKLLLIWINMAAAGLSSNGRPDRCVRQSFGGASKRGPITGSSVEPGIYNRHREHGYVPQSFGGFSPAKRAVIQSTASIVLA
jgi:hypothetical protein